MCGIAGGFSYASAASPIDRMVITRLNELQRRRGPDGEGLWSTDDGRVVLGHRRLAIIDTGASGAQPMTDATGRWTVTFNGEIYNYRELRSELERRGCVFLTNSDTEVLIHAVAQWGEVGLQKLRGMYAFALWDELQKEMWLVRDPFGIKPLYIAETPGTIWFASHARALARTVLVDLRHDSAAVVGFYLWGFVPEPFSWWSGIRLLPAGHVQRIRAAQTLPPSSEYASIQDAYVNRPSALLRSGELRELMLDSVRYHMVADVPVGVFLSSGVDSNVIAGLATELGGSINTVTLAFDEYAGTANDEAPIAEAMAKILRTEHNTVRIGRREFESLLYEFLETMDQPTTDGLNTYLVSHAAAKQGLKVALSGLGGDELFGGYPSFRQIPRLLKWGQYLPSSKTLTRWIWQASRAFASPEVSPKLAGILSYSGDIANAYFLRRALHIEAELADLLDAATVSEGLQRLSTMRYLTESVAVLHDADASIYAQVAALESGWYMRNQLLRDTDWSSMAHGVEVRVPFVDARVLDRLGSAIASGRVPGKRDLFGCAPQLPDSLLDRAKTGFTTPVGKWVQESMPVPTRGLRGWARYVDQHCRSPVSPALPRISAAA